MGISRLIPFLGKTVKKCRLNEFSGCSVAVDAYCLLHKGAFSCADQLVRGETTTAYVQYCLKYVNLLLSFRIKPIMVFDGQRLSAKNATECKRHRQRTATYRRANKLMLVGKTDEAKLLYRQCVDITHEMALQLIKECRNRNVDCIVAPYEADAQMAYLNLQGIVDVVITDDSDLVLFGCTKILFKLDLLANGMLVEKENLIKAMKMRPDKYTFAKFRHMCILSGCDYVESLPGIDLKQAHKAVNMIYDNIDQLLQKLQGYLCLSHIIITPEYAEQFKIADACFQHQIVYDPRKRQLVHLTPPKALCISQEYLKGCGQLYDNAKAYHLALGNIDPITYKVLDTWNPDDDNKIPSTSIWSKTYTKQEAKLKVSSTPILNAKSTPGEQVVGKISQVTIMAAEQTPIDFDNKLAKELQVYYKHKKLPEPVVTETLRAEIDLTQENYTQIASSPFITSKPQGKFGNPYFHEGPVGMSNYFKRNTEDRYLQLDNENSISKSNTVRNKVPKPETIVGASENKQNRNNNTSIMEIQNNLPDRATIVNSQLANGGPLLNHKNYEADTCTVHEHSSHLSESAPVHHKTKQSHKQKLIERNYKITGIVPEFNSPDKESVTHVPLNANTPADERVTVGNYQLDKGGLLSNAENYESNTFSVHSFLSHSSERASVWHKTKRSRKRKLPEQNNKITDMLPYI